MSQPIVCSICSRQKKEDAGMMPARERYLGTHISKVEGIALRRNLSFFVLSGKLGLLPGDECIPYYNYLLEADKVPELAELIKLQLSAYNIGKIYFHTKLKPTWQPYLSALQLAADDLRVEVAVAELADSD
jgi:hypothetical protein